MQIVCAWKTCLLVATALGHGGGERILAPRRRVSDRDLGDAHEVQSSRTDSQVDRIDALPVISYRVTRDSRACPGCSCATSSLMPSIWPFRSQSSSEGRIPPAPIKSAPWSWPTSMPTLYAFLCSGPGVAGGSEKNVVLGNDSNDDTECCGHDVGKLPFGG